MDVGSLAARDIDDQRQQLLLVSGSLVLLLGRYGYDLMGKPSRSMLTKAYDVFQSLSKCSGPARDPGKFVIFSFCIYCCRILSVCPSNTSIQTKRKILFCPHSYTIWKIDHCRFSNMKNGWWGTSPFYLKFWPKLTRRLYAVVNCVDSFVDVRLRVLHRFDLGMSRHEVEVALGAHAQIRTPLWAAGVSVPGKATTASACTPKWGAVLVALLLWFLLTIMWSTSLRHTRPWAGLMYVYSSAVYFLFPFPFCFSSSSFPFLPFAPLPFSFSPFLYPKK